MDRFLSSALEAKEVAGHRVRLETSSPQGDVTVGAQKIEGGVSGNRVNQHLSRVQAWGRRLADHDLRTPADMLVLARAINFLLISDGSAVLRYST